MFGSLGITELVLILVIVLIIFGAGKLPQLGEGVGKAIRGFKKSVHEANEIEAEAEALAEEKNQAQPAMATQQPAPDPSQISLQVAPAPQPDQMASVPPAQVAQPEPVQTSKV
ncbi:MAG: twin-arginine translocase TatA/TatE family subunit [Nitrospirales bacterium]